LIAPSTRSRIGYFGSYFKVTDAGTDFGWRPVGKPDCESDEPVVLFPDWPRLAIRERAAG
jgi:hypothetical protein